MDFAMSPFDKLKCFAKATNIIRNYLLLTEGTVTENVLKQLQLYVVIFATLNRLSSNLIYIEMFISGELRSEKITKLLARLKDIVNSIEHLNFKNFVGITEDEYNRKMAKMQAGD